MKKIIFTLSLLLLSSCDKFGFLKKNKEVSTNKIEGKVLLPEGSQTNLDELSVQSFLGSSGIDQGSYSIDVAEDDNNFLFVSDKSDEVILMSYNYPDQTDFDINAESTVIAMAMSLPITSGLSEAAKSDFIRDIKTGSGFSEVVGLMEQLIVQGASPLDISQKTFQENFLKMINDVVGDGVSGARISGDGYDKNPVKIIIAGNSILFQNAGKLYGTSIGIYKNGQRIEYIELDKIQFFSESASEAFRAANNLATQNLEGIKVVEKIFQPTEDGEYEIKIATGLNNWSSAEGKAALINNITEWSLDRLVNLLPLKGKNACIKAIRDELKANFSTYVALKDGSINTVADGLGISYEMSKNVLTGVSTGLTCLVKDSASQLFVKFVEKLFKWDTYVTNIGSAGNTMLGISQWIVDDATLELCYSKVGSKITECGFEGLSEDIQNVVPKAVLDSLIAKGVVINRGDTPPKLDFAIVVSPFELLSRYGPNDGYEVGRVIPDNFYRFFDQTQDNSIKYEYYSGNGTGSGTGVGSFIAGEGNSFTIFAEVRGVAGSEDYTSLNVVSGKLQNGGIADFQEAFILTYKSKSGEESRLIPVNTGRVWIDGDFISERYDNFSNGNSRKSFNDAKRSNPLMK